MTQGHPVVERYLSRLDVSIRDLAADDREEIAREIRNHIAEASAAGKPLDAVLTSLGPAETLARAYQVELVMNPRGRRLKAIGGVLSIVGMVAAGSLATLVVVTTLGSIAIAFAAGGVAIFFIALLEAVNIHLPGVQMAGVPPIVASLLGSMLFAVGLAAGYGLRLYVKFLAGALRRRLPRFNRTA